MPYRHYRPGEQLEFAIVAAIVRLSHKYQLDYVRDDFLERMKSCFGTDCGDWQSVSRHNGNHAMRFRDTDAISVVNIARLTGADSMLPTALYLCCQLDAEYIISGYRRTPDDTVESLSPEDAATCVNARQSLVRKSLADALDIFNPSLICHNDDDRCRSAIDTLRQNRLAQRADVLMRLFSGLRPNLLLIGGIKRQGLLCRACTDALRGAELKVFKNNWEDLPRLLCVNVPTDWT